MDKQGKKNIILVFYISKKCAGMLVWVLCSLFFNLHFKKITLPLVRRWKLLTKAPFSCLLWKGLEGRGDRDASDGRRERDIPVWKRDTKSCKLKAGSKTSKRRVCLVYSSGWILDPSLSAFRLPYLSMDHKPQSHKVPGEHEGHRQWSSPRWQMCTQDWR